MFFEGAGLSPDDTHDPQVQGMRRGLVEQYYSRIDFTSHSHVRRLLLAYQNIILQLSRSNSVEAEDLLRRMKADGYEFDGERFVPLPSKPHPLIEEIQALAAALDLEGLNAEVSRLAHAAEEDPPLAVGTAKEMVETVCKSILKGRVGTSQSGDLPSLVRAVAKELLLLPENIPNSAKGYDVIRRILSSLNQVAQGLAELRNLYGTGHGRDGRHIGIQPRHARLAVKACQTSSGSRCHTKCIPFGNPSRTRTAFTSPTGDRPPVGKLNSITEADVEEANSTGSRISVELGARA